MSGLWGVCVIGWDRGKGRVVEEGAYEPAPLVPHRQPPNPRPALAPLRPPARWVFAQLYKKGLVYRGFKVRGGSIMGDGHPARWHGVTTPAPNPGYCPPVGSHMFPFQRAPTLASQPPARHPTSTHHPACKVLPFSHHPTSPPIPRPSSSPLHSAQVMPFSHHPTSLQSHGPPPPLPLKQGDALLHGVLHAAGKL